MIVGKCACVRVWMHVLVNVHVLISASVCAKGWNNRKRSGETRQELGVSRGGGLEGTGRGRARGSRRNERKQLLSRHSLLIRPPSASLGGYVSAAQILHQTSLPLFSPLLARPNCPPFLSRRLRQFARAL